MFHGTVSILLTEESGPELQKDIELGYMYDS